jgi:hypothetical protein
LNLASIDLGVLPHFGYVDMVPVDFLAKAIAGISLQKRGREVTLNLAHPEPISPEKLVSLLRLGGTVVDLVPVEAWLDRARALIAERPEHPLAIFASLLAPTDPDANLLSLLTRAPPVGLRTTSAALAEARLTAPPIDARLLGTYQRAMYEAGLLRVRAESEPLLSFTETMIGHCGRSGEEPAPAALKARASVSSLARLLDDRRLDVSGTLTCAALDPEPLAASGHMEIRPFSSQSPKSDGNLVLISYELALRSSRGARYVLRGHKTATPGGNPWRQARTIDFEIIADGTVVATGQLQIPAGTYFDEQVRNIIVDPRLSPNEQLKVKAAWLGFLGLSISRTYLGATGAWLVRAFARQ